MHKYLLLKDKEIDHALFPPFLVNTQCIPFFRPALEAVISGMKALLDDGIARMVENYGAYQCESLEKIVCSAQLALGFCY